MLSLQWTDGCLLSWAMGRSSSGFSAADVEKTNSIRGGSQFLLGEQTTHRIRGVVNRDWSIECPRPFDSYTLVSGSREWREIAEFSRIILSNLFHFMNTETIYQ